jgi:hypothetical protein
VQRIKCGTESLFQSVPVSNRTYGPFLTIELNRKGVLDIDTVKGCSLGMAAYPNGGCYGECYAAKGCKRSGIDFAKSVSRRLHTNWHRSTMKRLMGESGLSWYRIGTAGDPSHDWGNTTHVIRALRPMDMTPVVVSKFWKPPTDEQVNTLARFGAVVNVSVSGMDTDREIEQRLMQHDRLRDAGVLTVLRVVTCRYGATEWARECDDKQSWLLTRGTIIDNPLRASANNPRVLDGSIICERRPESIGGGKLVSIHNNSVYIGKCDQCPDQCGIEGGAMNREIDHEVCDHPPLWEDKLEYKYVEAVIGSGYEEEVAALAIEDGIAHRAARKNMQIHSAIIFIVNGEFSGFMTFQNNHDIGEFCLLQSVIKAEHYTPDRYRCMVKAVLEANTQGYPAFITTDPKSKFETPALFESLGFQTNFKKSGFHYMTNADLESEKPRMKLLAHMTMVNVWNTTGGEWLKVKRAWNEKIEDAGIKHSVMNPKFATRDGCWQGTNGFANVVTGHSFNGNASVLDPAACEVILRMFMPADGHRLYNPFGGGVQFGFVAASYGYDYLASEIRQNQCDANNLLCSHLPGNAEWIQSDSSSYEPDGMFDLVFTCPPYFKVEEYLDYNGAPPEGELNSMDSYQEFKDALFAGYKIAIDHLNDECFFVVMTGDARDSKGAYLCSEAETELFMRDSGLSVYNRIVYVESAFTRMAHAKKTLKNRKFPKCEQKIIVGFKGDTAKIQKLYPPIGRL